MVQNRTDVQTRCASASLAAKVARAMIINTVVDTETLTNAEQDMEERNNRGIKKRVGCHAFIVFLAIATSLRRRMRIGKRSPK